VPKQYEGGRAGDPHQAKEEGEKVSKNIGWTKKYAKSVAKPLNTSVSIAYAIKEEHFRSNPSTHEWMVEVRKR